MNYLAQLFYKFNFCFLWSVTFISAVFTYVLTISPSLRKLILDKFAPTLIQFNIIIQCISATILIYLLLILVVKINRQKKQDAYVFPDSDGEASIDEKTIRHLTKSIVANFPSVKYSQIKSTVSNSKLDIYINIKVSDELIIKNLIENIRDAVRSAFFDLLGQEIIKMLHIKIIDVIPATKASITPLDDNSVSNIETPKETTLETTLETHK